MTIKWTEDLSCGVDFIDSQHKELFKRTNHLLEACMRGEGVDAVVATIAFLTQYVVEHFNAEEEVMRRARFAGYAEHAKMHKEFRKTVEAFGDEIVRKGSVGSDTVVKMNRLIVGWLNTHIRTVDRAMAAAIRKQAPEVLVSHA
jgi:hemerythrin